MYLKNANKGILQGIAVTGPNRTDQNRPASRNSVLSL